MALTAPEILLGAPPAATAAPPSSARLAIVPDFVEEGWTSMDRVSDKLLAGLRHDADELGLEARRIRPPYVMRAPRWLGSRRARNADRLFNRHWNYPRFLRRHLNDFDLFHICDHSYAHLVHDLPAERTGVFCHDLDRFTCLIDPRRDPRPRWFRAIARRVLRGMQKAAVVFHTTAAVRRQILTHGLLDESRLVAAPLAAGPEFHPTGSDDARPTPFVLHVGTCIPRKRIDILLQVFAGVRRSHPQLKLVQVGGEWTNAQREQVKSLGIGDAIEQRRGVDSSTLASLYRTAQCLLLPTEAEGFCMPLVEALACGCAVVASDIEVLREVGGSAISYCDVGDVPAWIARVDLTISTSATAAMRSGRVSRAERYSWSNHCRAIGRAYAALAGSSASSQTGVRR